MSSYIDGISQAATASKTTATSTTAADKKTEATLNKQDFLTLLVAQLQNQDPLNPDDPTEFTAQLAQFSSLEQLFNLNESMDNLTTSNANSDKFTTLNTIGKEVAYESSSFTYSGEPVNLGYTLDGQASEVTLALQLDGSTISLLKGTDLTKGTHYLNWDGLTANGKPAPEGDYKIVIQAKAAEGTDISAKSLIRSEVTGVDLQGDYGGTLVTGAGSVSFNSILGVFEKGSALVDSSASDEETDEETANETTNSADTVTDATTDAATAAIQEITSTE